MVKTICVYGVGILRKITKLHAVNLGTHLFIANQHRATYVLPPFWMDLSTFSPTVPISIRKPAALNNLEKPRKQVQAFLRRTLTSRQRAQVKNRPSHTQNFIIRIRNTKNRSTELAFTRSVYQPLHTNLGANFISSLLRLMMEQISTLQPAPPQAIQAQHWLTVMER